jgi:hypothetical protein
VERSPVCHRVQVQRLIAPIVSCALLLAACGSTTPTAVGTKLLEMTFTPEQGGPPEGLKAEPQRHTKELSVNPDDAAVVDVRLDVVVDPASGGRYLHGVEIVVVSNGDGELTATRPSGAMPTNMGSVEAPIASNRLMVEWDRDRGWQGRRFGQTSVMVSGDGTIER